jgi:hypothetical protein
MSHMRFHADQDTEDLPLLMWTDDSPESAEAVRLLKGAGIDFVELRNHIDAYGRRVPQLFTSIGEFPGVDLIRWYASEFGRHKQ